MDEWSYNATVLPGPASRVHGVARTQIAPGWPQSWAKFRILIGIKNIVGEISLPEYDIGERMTQSKRRAESRDAGQAGAISPPGRRQAARPRSPGLPADGGVTILRAAPCYMTRGYFPWGIPEEKERHAGKEPPPPMANPGRRTPRARRAARARHPSRRTCPRGKKDARHSERLPAFAHLCF